MTGDRHGTALRTRDESTLNQSQKVPMGHAGTTAKAPGHWILARLGKKVLRPGGLELTRRMLGSLEIDGSDDVVEFAPGLGATARLTLGLGPRSYIAVERDEQAAKTVRQLLAAPSQRCTVGRAEDTGLPDRCATVVYGEAMLTMQSASAKDRIVQEAARLLAQGGRYGVHEMTFCPETLSPERIEQICRELSGAIHHAVIPLTVAGWRSLLEKHGLRISSIHAAPMKLLEPRRLLADEGAVGAMRFAWNLVRDQESRYRVFKMRDVFRKYRKHLLAVMIVATKDDVRDRQPKAKSIT